MARVEEQSKKKLRLVEPRHELSGKVARSFERHARACKPGDAAHRGVLFTATTLTRRGLAECLPPSVLEVARQRLARVDGWARGEVSLKQLQATRSETFESLVDCQRKTLSALRAMPSPHAAGRSALDEHADRVVERYIALAVRHSLAAILLCCDAVIEPLQVLEVPGEVAGAIAYRNVGLGAARSAQLRASAAENAAWEAREIAASAEHGEVGLTLQLLHEYLGVHWKNHVDAQRLYLEQFLEWAVR